MRPRLALVALIGLLGATLAAACGHTVVVDPHGSGGRGAGGAGAGGKDTHSIGPGSTSHSDPTSTGPGSTEDPCTRIASLPLYCLTVLHADSYYLGLTDPTTGSVCWGAKIQGSDYHEASSLAVLGENAYFCDHDAGLIQVSIDTGAVNIAPYPCDAVTAWNGGLLIKASPIDPLELYSSFEDVLYGATPQMVIESENVNTRMTAQGDTLFTAWHATDQIEPLSLPSAEPLNAINLQGFEDWVNGMWATPDGRLLILSSDSIFTFEIESGQLLSSASLGEPFALQSGLYCWTNP